MNSTIDHMISFLKQNGLRNMASDLKKVKDITGCHISLLEKCVDDMQTLRAKDAQLHEKAIRKLEQQARELEAAQTTLAKEKAYQQALRAKDADFHEKVLAAKDEAIRTLEQERSRLKKQVYALGYGHGDPMVPDGSNRNPRLASQMHRVKYTGSVAPHHLEQLTLKLIGKATEAFFSGKPTWVSNQEKDKLILWFGNAITVAQSTNKNDELGEQRRLQGQIKDLKVKEREARECLAQWKEHAKLLKDLINDMKAKLCAMARGEA